LRAARAFRDTGEVPPGVDTPEVFIDARSGYFLAEPSQPWEALYAKQLAAAVRPVGTPIDAEMA
ncbi:MAG: hypothetical protein J0I19_09665, partial [Alphaproteobacteria bacterium]|nr:hypothetical protein [Alphaproteobacteria bacterium]